MPRRYLHFIDHDGLQSHIVRERDVQRIQTFSAGEEGVLEFSRWLQGSPTGLHTLLIDVADEGFHLDNIPHIFGPDRRALITRRLTQQFFGSPYATALPLGREKTGRRDERLLMTAITRPALLEPWLATLRRAEAPVTASYSVPLLTSRLVPLVSPDNARGLIMLLSPAGIRQIYFDEGRLRFSRLAPRPDGPYSHWGLDCVREAQKTYQYLSAQRWIPRTTPLLVRVVLAARDAGHVLQEIARVARPDDKLVFQSVPIEALAKSVGLSAKSSDSDSRGIVMQLALRESSFSPQLASKAERHFYRLWQARFATLVAGGIVLGASAVLAAKWAFETRGIRNDTASLRTESMLQQTRYKQLLDSLPQMPTSLDALRSTVEGIQRVNRQVVDPRQALIVLSHVVDGFPDVTLDGLEWQDVNTDRNLAVTQPNNGARYTLTVRASLPPEAATDPRSALTRIREFADLLRLQSGGNVAMQQQPFDAGSDKTLKSEVQNPAKRPAFSLQLSMPGDKP